MGKYDDIINLPHHVSERHPQMPIKDRAAQFSPFAALTGHEAAIKETARLTDEKAELSEEQRTVLDRKLAVLADKISEAPQIKITHFVPDKAKQGGAYEVTEGMIKGIDSFKRAVVLTDKTEISIDDIVDIECELFSAIMC